MGILITVMSQKVVKKAKAQYPSEWQGGIPRGSIQEKGNYYQVTVTPPKEKSIRRIFYFLPPQRRKGVTEDQIFSNRTDAMAAAERYRMKISDENDLTRNKWRKIDDDTIEVKTSKGDMFQTDYEHRDKVEQYPIFLKSVRNKYHVMSQDKKKQFPFYTLINPDIKMVEYIDENALNLKKSNIREFGTLDVPKVVQKKLEDESYDTSLNHYELSKDIEIPYVLPKNKWILGKPAGTIFLKNGCYHARIHNGEIYTSKTFRIKGGNKKSQYEKAIMWKYNTSYKLGLTKNLIKILDNEHIEVQLSKKLTMKTNIEMMCIIQQISLCSTKSGNKKSEYYAMGMIGRKAIKFHNLITQNDMTDHIDGDTLNNTLENLRSCDHSINNANRHYGESDIKIEKVLRDPSGREYFNIPVKVNGQYSTKKIYLKDIDAASRQKPNIVRSISYRYRQFLRRGEWDNILQPHVDALDIHIAHVHFTRQIEHARSNVLPMKTYIEGINKCLKIPLSSLEEIMIFNAYKSQCNAELYEYLETLIRLEKRIFSSLGFLGSPDHR